jgi:hypothetical protein
LLIALYSENNMEQKYTVLVNYKDVNVETVNIYTSVVCFLLGNSSASEFYMPTFRNTVRSIFIGG